ncbi:MAG TPA: Tex family protein [Clostridiales bacterium]|nr:MAG: 30S ribosomal protein S1 [Firmicutes bacterium ADurb.Bin262]HOU10168.1 Tex family protein [Clostridiales bacterium]HQK73086.1 Tex family protein [Clostridiales bacterium]
MDIIRQLTAQFGISEQQAGNTVRLIDEGNTIPFIARYRKEVHGGLDDQLLREISERLEYLRSLEKRKAEIVASIEAQEKMTPEIAQALENAKTLAEAEDIYLPYRPKKTTRASVARAKGLEPLALAIAGAQEQADAEPLELAAAYVDAEKGVGSAEDALKGALDILAENIAENAALRKKLRDFFSSTGVLETKASDKDAESVYTMYYDFRQAVRSLPGHRVLAIDRGEKEGYLKAVLLIDKTAALAYTQASLPVKGTMPCAKAAAEAAADAYSRLLYPAIAREIRNTLSEKASTAAIRLFAVNLKQLLMQPPLLGKTVLGLDPGYRTGCKYALADPTGKVLKTGVLYITHSDAQRAAAADAVLAMANDYPLDVIAIGNGTASRETEIFVSETIARAKKDLSYMVVSEAGASVYSASKLAAAEFPQFDVSLRSAVSIARRLQDPLAELVKVDPKSIGVGQYQHDMPQAQLDKALAGVVEQCVNSVGAQLNTASASLLTYIAGIGPSLAANIVAYREQYGAFASREELLKVPKLGRKAYEQCAGFLRVAESANALDSTSVHPESYAAAGKLLELFGFTAADTGSEKLKGLDGLLEAYGYEKAAQQLGIGVPTLRDIVKELKNPGRDPRRELPAPMLRRDVMGIGDLKPGMELQGTVRNVIDFGAFVDIGVHADGLVHISQIANRYIRYPSDVLHVGDIVTVWVLQVDTAKQRIGLTMIRPENGESRTSDDNQNERNVLVDA